MGFLPFFFKKRVIQIDLTGKKLIIKDGRREQSVLLSSLIEIIRNDDGILLRTSDRSVQIYHADFESRTEEDEFVKSLSVK